MSVRAMETVELPAGVEHGMTDGHALSWEAYNALTFEDGWVVKATETAFWKEAEIRGHKIVVFPPYGVAR